MRYMLFAGREYYPSGGGHDYQGHFGTPDLTLTSTEWDWAHVFDTHEQRVVRSWHRIPEGTKLGEPGWVTLAEYEDRYKQLNAKLRDEQHQGGAP